MENTNDIFELDEVETVSEQGETQNNALVGGMLIGAGLTIAISKGVKYGKQWYAKHKAKKAAKDAKEAGEATDTEGKIIDVDFEEVDE